MANLLLVFGLAMLDVFTVNVPQSGRGLGGRAWRVGPCRRRLRHGGRVRAGRGACGAPAFAAVLTFVAGTGSAVLGLLYLLVFSLGPDGPAGGGGLSSGLLAALPRPRALDPLGQARGRRAARWRWPSTTSCRMGSVL